MAYATVKVGLTFNRFIMDPMTPDKQQVINVEKRSGVNRLKNEDKRAQAIRSQLKKEGISEREWEELKKRVAERQWFYNPDGFIYIPAYRMSAAFVEGLSNAPKSMAGPYTKDNFRSMVLVSDFVTDQKEPTGVFARFVRRESNMRDYQSHEFLGRYFRAGMAGEMIGKPFNAAGVIECDEKQVATVKDILEKVMADIGIGSARKMGFGRGGVSSWSVGAV